MPAIFESPHPRSPKFPALSRHRLLMLFITIIGSVGSLPIRSACKHDPSRQLHWSVVHLVTPGPQPPGRFLQRLYGQIRASHGRSVASPQQITDLAGHSPGSRVTTIVYRHRISPSVDAARDSMNAAIWTQVRSQ